MKLEHEMFAHYYMLSGNKEQAYKSAYPDAIGTPLKTAARRLAQDPEIREFITKEMKEALATTMLVQQAEQQRIAEQEMATIALKRKTLKEMISGACKVQRTIRFKDHIEVVEEPLSPFAILRAIELDTKLAHQWYNKGNDATPPPGKKEEIKHNGYSLPLPPQREGHNIPPTLMFQELRRLGFDAFHDKHFGPEYMPGIRAKAAHNNPDLAKIYREKGEKMLDYVPTEEQFLEWRGVYAYQRKQAEKEKEEREAKTIIQKADANGNMPVPDLPIACPGDEPVSIPALYPAIPKSPPKEPGHLNPVAIQPRPIDYNRFNPPFPQCKKIPFSIAHKVNPQSLPPVWFPTVLSKEEIAQKLNEIQEQQRHDPDSIYNTPPPAAIQNDTKTG